MNTKKSLDNTNIMTLIKKTNKTRFTFCFAFFRVFDLAEREDQFLEKFLLESKLEITVTPTKTSLREVSSCRTLPNHLGEITHM